MSAGWATAWPGKPWLWTTNLAEPAPAPACPIHAVQLVRGHCDACYRAHTAPVQS